jgi:hypothetical protein
VWIRPAVATGTMCRLDTKKRRFYPLRPWVFMGDQEWGDLPLAMINGHPGAEVGGDFSIFFVIVKYYEY